MSVRSRSSGPEGVTLIEMVMSIVILSVALTSILLVTSLTSRSNADPLIVVQSAAVAEAYLEEILVRNYYDPSNPGVICPAAEATRAEWDNVCDYNGLTDNGAEDQGGNAVAGLENYTIQVTVDTTANLNGLSGDTNVIRVDVRVTHSDLVDLTVSGYRTNF